MLRILIVGIMTCGLWGMAKQKRPNILFILVDDQSPYDLKIYDPKSPLETPYIDRLAAEGMVFDGAPSNTMPSAARRSMYGVSNGDFGS